MRSMKYSFTMAEILISLTIIGVIAAITLPALIGNVNERAWDAQRRALRARMAQAISMMPALTGYGEYSATWQAGDCPNFGFCQDSITIHNDNTAMSFVTKGLGKVMQLKNVCDHEHLTDCGLPEFIKKADNSSMPMPTRLSELSSNFLKRFATFNGNVPDYDRLPNGVGTDSYAAAAETLNGESLLVLYNHKCIPQADKSTVRQLISEYEDDSHNMSQFYTWVQHIPSTMAYFFVQSQVCVNFIYDLNGLKGPNKINKDIGYVTVFYPTDSDVVTPIFTGHIPRNPENNQSFKMQYNLAARACEKMDKNSRVATLSEIMAMMVNRNLYGSDEYDIGGWGGGDAPINENYAWATGGVHGWVMPMEKTVELTVGCVKR